MPIGQVDLQIDQGTDWAESFVFATGGTNPQTGAPDPAFQTYYNLTGCSALMEIHGMDEAGSVQFLSLSIGTGLTLISDFSPGGPPTPVFPNGIKMTITNAQSVLLPVGVWAYDLIITLGGEKTCYLKGNFTVRATVSR